MGWFAAAKIIMTHNKLSYEYNNLKNFWCTSHAGHLIKIKLSHFSTRVYAPERSMVLLADCEAALQKWLACMHIWKPSIKYLHLITELGLAVLLWRNTLISLKCKWRTVMEMDWLLALMSVGQKRSEADVSTAIVYISRRRVHTPYQERVSYLV